MANLTPADFDLDTGRATVTLAARLNKSRKLKVQPLPPDVAAALPTYFNGRPGNAPIWGGTWARDRRATEMLRGAVEATGAAVLAARAKYPAATLADLYDSLTMPPDLTKAHAELDRAVERCYRPEPFAADRDRVEFLFAEYERLTNPLTAGLDAKPRRRTAKPQAE